MQKIDVDIACPSCKAKIKTQLVKMKPGNKLKCPKCKAEITFSGDDFSKVQKKLDDLLK